MYIAAPAAPPRRLLHDRVHQHVDPQQVNFPVWMGLFWDFGRQKLESQPNA
jgi:hypothetical protein